MNRTALASIVFDAGTQIRAAINESLVSQYAERMTEGDMFPPIVLFHDGTAHYLADGFHRFMAARRNDFRDIDADVRPGTKQDALWFALGANKANGQRLTEADKTHAVMLAFETWPERSSNQLAEQIGCSAQYVQQRRAKVPSTWNLPERVTGKDGKSYPASHRSPQRDPGRPELIAQLLKDGKTNEEIISIIGANRHDLIAKVRRELGMTERPDTSRSAVAKRKQDVRDMAERGFTTRQIAAALHVGEQAVGKIASKEGIRIHADRVIGRARRHDSTRILETIVMDAENLTADENLIDFSALEIAAIARWVDSLVASHKSLAAFIRRLKKEQHRVQAA